MPRSMQASFVAGEIAPALRARVDLEQYLRGVALARNQFVRAFGGLANRAGTRFIDYTFEDRLARLIPFRFDDDQQYALEFTTNYLRFFIGGGQLRVPPTTAVLSHTAGGGVGDWNDLSTGTASSGAWAIDNPPNNSIELVGAAASVAIAEQAVANASPNVEHVLVCFIDRNITIRIGSTSGDDDILADRVLAHGWHTVAFTPGASARFYLRLFHADAATRFAVGMSFCVGPLVGVTPYTLADLPNLTWTQKADILTLACPTQRLADLKRYGPLSWSLEFRSFAPSLPAPAPSAITTSVVGTPATDYYYQVTYQADSGEESLPCPFITVNGAATLSYTDHVRITLAQPYPAGIRRALVYKFRGGVWGFLGQLPEGQPNFDDDGSILPKIDQTPPGDRNPFAEAENNPACVAYWEQRLALAGSAVAPDTVEMSRPGAFYNFGRSSPTRDDDAITFTPAGNLVRRIRHIVGAKALYLFTDSAVLAARRGDTGVTPAMEGGVSVELAKGATAVPPVQVGESVLFVTSAGRSLYSLSDRASTEGFVGQEVSLLSEHLLLESPIVDAAWCEVPYNLLWLVRADGKLVVLSYLDRQQVFGWGWCDTAGRFESVCSVREGGEDFLYAVVRRRLGGQWRRCVERMATRRFTDIKDAYFVDCGLSLDNPVAITGVGGNAVAAPGHGLAPGDLLDIDGTGVPELDGKRFKAAVVEGDIVALGDRNSGAILDGTGWTPWLEGGVLRKCLRTLNGLDHLNGQTVTILADGSEHPQRVVTAGSITLQRPASRAHVGLPITSDGQTLNIAEPPDGYGGRKRVVKVQAFVNGTRGLLFGPDFDRLSERKARSDEPWSAPAEAKSGLVEIGIEARWGVGGQICWRQTAPLPFELLAVLPVFERSSE